MKILTIVCLAVQALIIGLANLFAIAIVMNWFTDTIGYHGFWNIPVSLIVAAMVLATLAVYMNSIASRKL